MLDCRGTLLDGLQNAYGRGLVPLRIIILHERTCCSIDRGVKKVLLGVCDVEVELYNVEQLEKKRRGVCNLRETQCG